MVWVGKHKAHSNNVFFPFTSVKKGKFNFLILNPRLFYYDHKLLHISVPKSTNKNFIKEYEKYCIIAHICTHTQNHVKLTGYKSQSHEGGYRFLCFYGHVMMFRYLLNFLAVSSASYYIFFISCMYYSLCFPTELFISH